MKKSYLQIIAVFIVLTIAIVAFFTFNIKNAEIGYLKQFISFEEQKTKHEVPEPESKKIENRIDITQNEINVQKNLESSSNVDKPITTHKTIISQEQQIIDFYNTISTNELKVYSQNKEDGVTVTIFNLLNIKDLKKYYVEIGTENGKKKHKYN